MEESYGDTSFDDEFMSNCLSNMSTNLDGMDEMGGLEMGNNINDLKNDPQVQRELVRYLDCDSESIESGFSEQDGGAQEELAEQL